MASEAWTVEASDFSKRVNNPIRKIVDNIKMPNDPDKPIIPLSLGDPTVFGNFKAPACLTEAVMEAVRDSTANGYVHSAGTPAARAAIAAASSVEGFPVTADDVVIASGCSGALDLAISALLNPGDNILLPRPGFSLYQTLAEAHGAECKFYNLDPERNWEADLAHMESLVDARTRCVLVNNPSNPCGSVFSDAHLRAILEVAARRRLPVIADEIYGDMVFSGHTFTPLAALSADVPVLSTGGIAKRFLVPGWRVGWVVVHDRNGILKPVRDGLYRLSQMTLGATAPVQAALPTILAPVAGSPQAAQLDAFHAETRATLEAQAAFTVERLSAVPALRVIVPQGAMYVMCGLRPGALRDVKDDVEFVQKLLDEESVFVLPGQCFGLGNYFRIVFTAPKDKLATAYDRIAAFCERHAA